MKLYAIAAGFEPGRSHGIRNAESFKSHPLTTLACYQPIADLLGIRFVIMLTLGGSVKAADARIRRPEAAEDAVVARYSKLAK